MYPVLAILILAVVCILAAPVVLGVLLRVIVFAACLVVALLLREFVAEGIVFLFPVNLVVAEIAAVILLYLALRSLLRRCLQQARSTATLSSWKVIGIDLVSAAIPGSLLLVGVGGINDAPIEAIERIACRAREIRNIPCGLLPPEDEDPRESPDDQVGPQGPETGENGQNESDRLTPPEEFGGHDGS